MTVRHPGLILATLAGGAMTIAVAMAQTAPSTALAPATMVSGGPTTLGASTTAATDPSGNRDGGRRDNSRRDGGRNDGGGNDGGRNDGGRRDGGTATPPSATTPAGGGGGRRPPPANEYADRFAVVGDLNMFVRERVRRNVPGPGDNSSRPSQPPATPETVHVLRGVMLEEGAFRAYFENTQQNQIVKVTAGDPLARGHVVEISIDAVAFEKDGAIVWVAVGDNLVGAKVGAGAPSASGAASGGTPTAGTPTAGTPAEAGSVEERMRQRRAQRAGGGAGGGP